MIKKVLLFILMIGLSIGILVVSINAKVDINLAEDVNINILYYINETDPFWTSNFSNMQIDCGAGKYAYGVDTDGSLKCRDDETTA